MEPVRRLLQWGAGLLVLFCFGVLARSQPTLNEPQKSAASQVDSLGELAQPEPVDEAEAVDPVHRAHPAQETDFSDQAHADHSADQAHAEDLADQADAQDSADHVDAEGSADPANATEAVDPAQAADANRESQAAGPSHPSESTAQADRPGAANRSSETASGDEASQGDETKLVEPVEEAVPGDETEPVDKAAPGDETEPGEPGDKAAPGGEAAPSGEAVPAEPGDEGEPAEPGGQADASEPPDPSDPAKPAAPDGPADTAEPEQSPNERPLREQTIYIPYGKLREVFEKEGRGVFLPYEKFQELWRAAQAAAQAAPESRPPVAALIREIDSIATVERDVVQVEARLRIELLAEGWSEVPLALADSAILSARIGDEPARLAFRPEQGYVLVVENPAKAPREVELVLTYAKAFERAPGRNNVSFLAPQAPVNRWQIRVPDPGVKVNIQPLIAATMVDGEMREGEIPDRQPESGNGEPPAAAAGQGTTLLAFVGAAPQVAIDWTPRSEGAAGLAALANVEAQHLVYLSEGVMRTTARLEYQISRAQLTELVLEVPVGQRVVNVFDPNVRSWQVVTEGDRQVITAALFDPAQGRQSLTVELEAFLEGAAGEMAVPVVQARNVGQQQGIVLVNVAEGLRAEPSREAGLLRVDLAELPENVRGVNWAHAFRYAVLPFELVVRIEKLSPQVSAVELVEVWLEPAQVTLALSAVLTVERAGVFELELEVPPGFDVRDVRGESIGGAEPLAIDSFRVMGEESSRLLINLARKAFGRVGLYVECARRLEDPNLLAPTGMASTFDIRLTRLVADRLERTSGRLLIYAPEALRLTPGQTLGLAPQTVEEALAEAASAAGDRFSHLRAVLAFAFSRGATGLSLSVERRRPQITAAQLLVARVEPGVVQYEATFYYTVRYSGVKSLRIDIPARLAEQVRIQTAGLRDRRLDPQPADVAEGYVAFAYEGDTELTGEVQLQLAWEQKNEALDVGKSIELEMPQLLPREVDRAWGQVVLARSETIDVAPAGKPRGLRPIDPQHDLMRGIQVADAARAFEFHDAWTLLVSATRYELEEVKRTSIERAVVRMVITRSDRVAVQAVYRLRSARQRLALVLPAGAQFDTDPLRINGRPVPLERGAQQNYLVPLVGLDPNLPFVLDVRYTVPGTGSELVLADFPDEPAVQKLYLAAYVPQEQALLGYRGAWTDEQVWRWHFPQGFQPQPSKSEVDLLSWVTEGTTVSWTALQGFPIDGTPYLFSALQPDATVGSRLRLVRIDERVLAGIVLAVLGVLGIALTRRPMSERWLAIGGVFSAMVLAAVFLPTFARQVLDPVFGAGVLVVVAVWGVQGLAKWRPAWPARAKPAAGGASALAEPFAARPVEAAMPGETAQATPPEQGQPPGTAADRAANPKAEHRAPEGGTT